MKPENLSVTQALVSFTLSGSQCDTVKKAIKSFIGELDFVISVNKILENITCDDVHILSSNAIEDFKKSLKHIDFLLTPDAQIQSNCQVLATFVSVLSRQKRIKVYDTRDLDELIEFFNNLNTLTGKSIVITI